MANPTTSSYRTANGTEIYRRLWNPVEGKPRAVVIQVHGLGEHSGRYQHVADYLGAMEMALLAYDHTGHGKSGGNRGHVPTYDQLLEEVDLAVAEARKHFVGVPLFLYGHSWGGNIALNHLLRRPGPFKAAIITGPWLRLPKEPPAIQVFMGKLIKGIAPGFAQNTGLDTNALSHDPAVGKAYREDPLVHGKISATNFFGSQDAASYALENAGILHLPTLLMHGGEDTITSPKGSAEFAAKAGKNVQLRIWDGMYHEIHNEIGKAEVLDVMGAFLEREMA